MARRLARRRGRPVLRSAEAAPAALYGSPPRLDGARIPCTRAGFWFGRAGEGVGAPVLPISPVKKPSSNPPSFFRAGTANLRRRAGVLPSSPEMSSASARESKEVAASTKSKGASAAAAAVVAAPAHTLGRGSGSAAGRTLGRGSGSAAAAAEAAARPITGALGKGAATAPSSIDGSGGFPFPPSPSPAWWDAAGVDPISPAFGRSAAWDPSWEKDPRFSAAFMRYFGSQPHNFHLVGATAISPLTNNNEGITSPEVEILYEQEQPEQVNNDSDNVRTEKRILWTEEEDVRLMSSWIEHS